MCQAVINASVDAQRGRVFIASQHGGAGVKNESGQQSESGHERYA